MLFWNGRKMRALREELEQLRQRVESLEALAGGGDAEEQRKAQQAYEEQMRNLIAYNGSAGRGGSI